MHGDVITLFMWGFQRPFRSAVEMATKQAMKELGEETDPVVLLVGLLKEGGTRHPVCIEPEDGPIVPGDFEDLPSRALELYALDPESKIRASVPWLHERRQEATLDRSYGKAIAEILEDRVGHHLRFFVSYPTLVEEHFVYAAIGLPADRLDSQPGLTAEYGPDGRRTVTRSLVRGALSELLRASTRALRAPDAGAAIGLGVSSEDICRAAGRALTDSVVLLSGNEFGPPLFDHLNQVSTMRYEQRMGLGRLIVGDTEFSDVSCDLMLTNPVPMSETRTVRKLLEVSSAQGASLLTDGDKVYGIGRLKDTYDPSLEHLFEIRVVGHGSWEVRHAGVTLMTVVNGAPRLPEQPLDRDRFDDITTRVFAASGGCDGDALWSLVGAASDAEHGTMLVISAAASDEAARLSSQALPIKPARLDQELVRQVTGIDGALLVDTRGLCHGIGVIVDGAATDGGDRSRGARYNAAIKYLKSAADTVIVLVSEDGMINLLPDLRPRMSRSDIDGRMSDLREAASIEPVHPERFYKAYERIKAAAFYLSEEQCAEANSLREEHWERRLSAGAQIRVIESPLKPNPAMSDEYLTD